MKRVRTKQRVFVGLYVISLLATAVFVLLDFYPANVLAFLAALAFLGVLMVFQNYSGRVATHRSGANKQMLKRVTKQCDDLQAQLSDMQVKLDALRAIEGEIQRGHESQAIIQERLDVFGERAGLRNPTPEKSGSSQMRV